MVAWCLGMMNTHSLGYMDHCIVFLVLMYSKCNAFGENECAAWNQVKTGKLVQYQKNTDLLVQPEFECLISI